MGFFTKDIKTMDDLFMHGLKDLYYAENQIAKSLPDMIKKATNPQLRAGCRASCATGTRIRSCASDAARPALLTPESAAPLRTLRVLCYAAAYRKKRSVCGGAADLW